MTTNPILEHESQFSVGDVATTVASARSTGTIVRIRDGWAELVTDRGQPFFMWLSNLRLGRGVRP